MRLGSRKIIRSRKLSIIRETHEHAVPLRGTIKDRHEISRRLSVAVGETLILRS
jgi:hypothetical protein